MTEKIGKYQIARELGSGHFGTVYLAWGEVPNRGRKQRWVAIKRLNDSADRKARQTLIHEFALMEQVKHRSLVKVYEFLESEYAIVMEHVHGVTLRQVLDQCSILGTPVFAEAAAEIGCEIADCLYQSYVTPGKSGKPLHLVHRDIKPENVMVTPNGEVKVLDFGLARVGRLDPRKAGTVGTPLYMAPEQALGRPVDHQTDLFATGLLLYELLMNRPAYRVEKLSLEEIDGLLKRIEKAELRQEAAEISRRFAQLAPIVLRCLKPSPRQRFEDGHELMLELSRTLSGKPGANLTEFCDYCFVDLVDLQPLSSLENGDSSPSRPRGQDKRRVEQMAKPPRPGGPPRPPRPGGASQRPGSGSRGGPARPSPTRPAGGPPAGPQRPAAAAKGGKSWSPPGGAAPAPPKKEPPARKVAEDSSARSPDETGMLDIVSMKDGEE
ncbi:MAG: serine/threonine protein kinase, partial [Proteobacteria bacterium]|nr:serine/threonine protein kinase [Pseudomonadota bacterium]